MVNAFERPESGSADVERNASIERYLAEVLPDTEGRIAQPMDPHCEVAVVIPSSGERKYFFRPIESLLNQKGVTPDQFELIFVINNAEPQRKLNESEEVFTRRVAQAKQGALENQEVLKILRMINGKDGEVVLSQSEQTLVERIRAAKLKVFAINKADEGKVFASEKANVGGARNRGVAEAVARFYEIKKNGLVIQTDADAALDEHFIAGAITLFRERPELTGASGYVEMDTTVEKGEVIEKVYYFAAMEKVYRNLLHYYLTSEQDFPKRKNFTGANMISRAYETGVVGGVPEIAEKEDVLFGKRLDKVGMTARIEHLIVRPIDRVSLRTAGTKKGHGHIRAQQSMEVEAMGEIAVYGLRWTETVGKVEEKVASAVDFANLKDVTIFEGTPLLNDEELEELWGELEAFRVGGGGIRTARMKMLIDKMSDVLEERIPKLKITEAGQQIIDTLCKNQSLCAEYKRVLDDMSPDSLPAAPAGLDVRYVEMNRKLRAMDKAKRKI